MGTNKLLSQRQIVKRAALLCVHFTRNLAYSNAINKTIPLKREGDFWTTMLGNCIDMAVLEWSKIFVDQNSKYHWKRVLEESKHEDFRSRLLSEENITKEMWIESISSIQRYRNSFVAHLANEDQMDVPLLETPRCIIAFFFNCIHPGSDANYLYALPNDLNDYYINCLEDAMSKTSNFSDHI